MCPDVVTNCALHDLVDLHRLRGASATCLVTAKMEPEDGAPAKKKDEDERDIMGLDSSTRWGTVFDPDEAHQRLLYLASQDEIQEGHSCPVRISVGRGVLILMLLGWGVVAGVSLHTSMLRRCPSIKMHTNLVDSSVYVFAPWVVSLLQEGAAGEEWSSIKDELMPFLVRHQHRSSSKRIPEGATQARLEHLEVHNPSPYLYHFT